MAQFPPDSHAATASQFIPSADAVALEKASGVAMIAPPSRAIPAD